jgi:hypothetical protein
MPDKKRPIGENVFFVPKIASDRGKRENISNIRQSRRQSLKTANTTEERQAIRDKAREDIRTQRGGVSQMREVFTDVKDFADQVNQLKANIQGTTVGRVARLSQDVLKHMASGNYQGLAQDVQKGVDIARKGRNNEPKKDNCSC